MTRRSFLIGTAALAGCQFLPEDDDFWVEVSLGTSTFRCSKDYYSVGDVRTPLGLQDALRVASSFGAKLPTKEQVDAI